MKEQITMDVFSDYIWPWCYFITGRIERLQKEYEIAIHWKAFPLHPEIPKQGMTLEDLFAGRGLDIPQMMAHLKAVAQKEGLPLNIRTMTFNTRLAQELGKWAEKHGKGDEFHNAVFRAYFVQGKNIGDVDELVSLSESVGLSGKESRNVLEKRTFKEAVDLDWSRAYEMGITAVPTFVMNGQVMAGAQPYEVLERFVKINNVRKRDSDQ